MCGFLKFRRFRTKLRDMEKRKEKAYEQLEQMTDTVGCGKCDCYDASTVREFVDRFATCNCDKRSLLIESAAKADQTQAEVSSFLENEYAAEVFRYYSSRQPDLIRKSTGDVVTWKEAFGEDFNNVPKTLRYSLVGLVEGSGRYRLK